MRMKSLQYLLSLAQERESDIRQMLNEIGQDPSVDERVLEFHEELDTIQDTIEELKLQIRKGRD